MRSFPKRSKTLKNFVVVFVFPRNSATSHSCITGKLSSSTTIAKIFSAFWELIGFSNGRNSYPRCVVLYIMYLVQLFSSFICRLGFTKELHDVIEAFQVQHMTESVECLHLSILAKEICVRFLRKP